MLLAMRPFRGKRWSFSVRRWQGATFLLSGLHFSKTISAISRGVPRFTERNSKWVRTATYEIADAEQVNERRRAVGLNSIEERTKEIRAGQEPEHPDPQTKAESEQK